MRKIYAKLLLFLSCWLVSLGAFAGIENPKVISDMLDRIGGAGASDLFETEIDETLSGSGKEVFVITSKNSKPCIKGSTTLALTTGINWYLNHYAYVNLSWSKLTTNLSNATLPVPTQAETRTANTDYRYYLNYCTFSYSMAVWTWERWQQEIDWMALHGVNMPLQIVGTDVVWKKVLTELGYTTKEINAYISGPAFQAWWLMNNQEGWGGENPEWWYTRQEALAKDIMSRMHEFGMEPVLPGYSGMVPSNAKSKLGWDVANPGTWCSFQRPGFLVPTDANFSRMSELYYKYLEEVLGKTKYYSMDPFHEGGSTAGLDLNKVFTSIYKEMDKASPGSVWVVQNWGSNPSDACLNTVPKGKLIVLDLFADATPHWQSWSGFKGHEMIYCMLHNFGGRVGLHGRLQKTVSGYYDALAAYPSTMKGVGATPEGIETNPMLYDALFELPWRTRHDSYEWLKSYASARYGVGFNQNAYDAWRELAGSVYNCPTQQQGTSEPIICARPAMTVNSVSTWSTSAIYWKTEKVRRAVALMLEAKNELGTSDNYKYDLVDFTRQAVTDYASALLKQINANYPGNIEKYKLLKDRFLQLILDQDKMLGTVPDFMVGRWTESAKAVTNGIPGTSQADKDWMEWNARTQISVWGTEDAANGGGLHDYSNREWSGILKDLHYVRWKKFFDLKTNGQNTPSAGEWFAIENAWAKSHTVYPATPQGSPLQTAETTFAKYFGTFTYDGSKKHYFSYKAADDMSDTLVVNVNRASTYACSITVPEATSKAVLYLDLNGNNTFDAGESFQAVADGTTRSFSVNIPADAAVGKVMAQLVEDVAEGSASAKENEQTFGTTLKFGVALRDLVTTPRTISVATSDESKGTGSIEGTTDKSITTVDDVVVKASPLPGYLFLNWTNKIGEVVSTTNPYIYMGKEAIDLTANFVVNKWKTPQEDNKDYGTIESYGQFLHSLTITKTGGTVKTIYETKTCPTRLFNIIPTLVDVARGSGFKLAWTNTTNGLNFCRLSAYIDINNDGDFNDESELLDVRGAKESSTNTTVSNGNLQILLPANMPVGVTHIRLRFDGAWSGNWDPITGAAPADSKTERMVYEIQLNVTELPSEKPVIEVVSNNESMGTVDINGMGNPSTVEIGSMVILQAQPITGYVVDKWVDQYGRTVSTDRNYSFIPAESGKFTAYFKKAMPTEVVLGDFTFDYTVDGTHLTLTRLKSGSGDLMIPPTYDINEVKYNVTALKPGILNGNKDITSISLGTNLTNLGNNVIENTSWMGSGAEKSFLTRTGVGKGKPWRVTFSVTRNDNTYNTYGSSLLATGAQPLANSYPNGFQLYLAKAGHLSIKCGSAMTDFLNVAGSTKFDVDLLNDGKGTLTMTTTSGTGTKESHSITSFACDSLFQFSYALPTGINVAKFVILESQEGEDDLCGGVAPFKGCVNLSKITASSTNSEFLATSRSTFDVLYNKARTRLICFPPAKEMRQFSVPSSVTEIANSAFSGVTKLERIIPSSAVPAVAKTNAFDGCKALCAVDATSADSYYSAWGIPLLISVEDELATAITPPLKVIEILSSDSKTGEVTSPQVTSDYKWLTHAFSSSTTFTPLFFSHNIDSIVAPSSGEASATNKTLVIGRDIIVYEFDGTSFVEKSSGVALPAGAYLLRVSGIEASGGVTFMASNTGGKTTGITGTVFKGNGEMKAQTVNGNIYLYDADENVFKLQTGEVRVRPFQAYMQAFGENCPQLIPGISPSGIKPGEDGKKGVVVEGNQIKVIGYDNYSIYNSAGVMQQAETSLRPGTYIVVLPTQSVKINIK